MSRNRVGDAMIAYMVEEGFFSLCVHDGAMNDVWFHVQGKPLKLWKGMNPHPVNRAMVVASYIARDDRFEITLMRGHDINERSCVLRLFKLKEEFRD